MIRYIYALPLHDIPYAYLKYFTDYRNTNKCLLGYIVNVRGFIQNIPAWCLQRYSICGSAKHR
jgi:hypothetical protein